MIPPSADIQLHSAYKCPFCVNCHEMWRWTWSRIEREMGVWPFTELNCNIVDDEEEEEVRELISVLSTELKSGYPPPISPLVEESQRRRSRRRFLLGLFLSAGQPTASSPPTHRSWAHPLSHHMQTHRPAYSTGSLLLFFIDSLP